MSAAVPYVQACAPVDLDTSTGVCSHPYWVQQAQPSLLPPLSVADGATIGAAILACWAVGFGIRCVRRAL